VIDFHTGLGAYGYGEPITHYDIDTPASRRVRAFWGESVTESKRGQTASQARDGLGHYGLLRVLTGAARRGSPCARLSSAPSIATAASAPFAPTTGCTSTAIRWEGGGADPDGNAPAFYPDTVDWKEAVLFRGHQVCAGDCRVQRGAI
jgi:hypothetical protein